MRGRGLLIGVELVKERDSREPDAAATERVQMALLASGVVVGICGRDHNVLKVNPPLCVTGEDAQYLLDAMDEALAER